MERTLCARVLSAMMQLYVLRGSRSLASVMLGSRGMYSVVSEGRSMKCVAVVHIPVELMRSEHAAHGAILHFRMVHITQVNLVNAVVLTMGEPEFHGHSVGHHTCCGASLTIRHCTGGDGYRHHQHQSYHHLFHCFIVLMVLHLFLFSLAKVSHFQEVGKG